MLEQLIQVSLGVAGGTFVILFVFSLFLSNWAVKPVASALTVFTAVMIPAPVKPADMGWGFRLLKQLLRPIKAESALPENPGSGLNFM